ncbi:MAG: hypothetical protein ACRDZR_14925 [Acidimicrobiales bacterium]
MNVELSNEEAEELRAVLDGVLGELSTEIADTDNASFRASLQRRRDLVRGVHVRLGG